MSTGEGTWTCSACGLIFESRQQCLLHMRAAHVLPEPKAVVFKPAPAEPQAEPQVVYKPPPADLADPAPVAAVKPPSAGDIRRDRADALYVYHADGAWRLQNPHQQRMLIKIKKLDVEVLPYLSSPELRRGTSLSPRRRAARLPPLRQIPQLRRLSPLLQFLRLRRRRQVLPSLRRKLRGALPPLLRKRQQPTHGDLAGRLG